MPLAPTTFSSRDLLTVPGILTLARLPLAVMFGLLVHRPLAASAVLGLAAASDVLDGWYARKFRQSSATGALADAIVDKVFVGAVAVSLVLSGLLGLVPALLLGVRDVGEIALGASILRSAPRELTRSRKAHPLSKITTALQFVTVAVCLWRLPWVDALALATAVTGSLAVAQYWTSEYAGRSA